MLLAPMVCSAWLLVVGGQVQGSRVCVQEEGCCTTKSYSIPEMRSGRKATEISGVVRKCK